MINNIYEKNKDKINEKITCECGSSYTRQNKSQHLKSNKHKNFMEELERKNQLQI
jgi:hypothetical protein